MEKKLIYDIGDKPKFGQMLVFAVQQLLAIMAATIAVPAIVGNGMSASAALFGAGVGTIVYQLFTKFRSPVFLGSSFAFIGSMVAAFAGATASVYLGYLGLILGAVFAGLVYARSGLATKKGLAPANKVGVIDADYRGEIMVPLHNHSRIPVEIEHGERIAQMIITPFLTAEYMLTDELDETERGEGGFGSTGTK